jgi:hypothetical protein
MKRTRRGFALLVLMGGAIIALSTSCSGNRNVRVGGSIHRTSGGGWGHSIGVGIQSNGRR